MICAVDKKKKQQKSAAILRREVFAEQRERIESRNVVAN